MTVVEGKVMERVKEDILSKRVKKRREQERSKEGKWWWWGGVSVARGTSTFRVKISYCDLRQECED